MLSNTLTKTILILSFLFLILGIGYCEENINNCGIYDYSRNSNAEYLPPEGCYFEINLSRDYVGNEPLNPIYLSSRKTHFTFRLDTTETLNIGISKSNILENNFNFVITMKTSESYNWSIVADNKNINLSYSQTYLFETPASPNTKSLDFNIYNNKQKYGLFTHNIAILRINIIKRQDNQETNPQEDIQTNVDNTTSTNLTTNFENATIPPTAPPVNITPDTPKPKPTISQTPTQTPTQTSTTTPAQTTTPKAPEFWKKFFETFKEKLK